MTDANLEEVDFTTQGGVWVPCAGSVTPWQTHLGSEEYPYDAKAFFDMPLTGTLSNETFSSGDDVTQTLRYFDYYASKVSRATAIEKGFNVISTAIRGRRW